MRSIYSFFDVDDIPEFTGEIPFDFQVETIYILGYKIVDFVEARINFYVAFKGLVSIDYAIHQIVEYLESIGAIFRDYTFSKIADDIFCIMS